MQLIGYLFNINSDRQLCREIQLNLAYCWFCKLSLEDKVPHHSSLSRRRHRFGVVTYEKIFNKLLKQWLKAGYIGCKTLYTDATLVSANAATSSLVPREDADPNARALKAYERRYHDFKTGKKKENMPTKLTSVKLTLIQR